MNLNTILFDLDGTLIDTNELIISSFQHTLEKFQVTRYGREDIVSWIGEPLYDSFARIAPHQADEMVEVYRAHNLQHHDQLIKAYPGVLATVRKLSELNFRLGVVTSKRKETAIQGLRRFKLDPFFPVIIAIDDVKRPKPDPEPIVTAMRELNSVKRETLMVGDSPQDIRAGQKAGVRTAAVSWSLKGKEALEALCPDYFLNEMKDILELVGVGIS